MRVAEQRVYAGIELGGTKVLCRVADAAGTQLGAARFATTTPGQALADLAGCIDRSLGGRALHAIGVASFGPLVIDPQSPRFGRMLATPKPGWSDFDLHAALRARFPVPIAIETDVNAAAVAEQACGAGRGLRSVAYVTVGTGIGGALAVEGQTLKGALHPEIGHMRLRRRSGDELASTCPYHEDCVEGLVAGPALSRRLGGAPLAQAPPQVLTLLAHYLGDLAANLVLAWSPNRIVFGGGVIQAAPLLPLVDTAMRAALGGYGAGSVADADYLAQALLTDAGLEGALMIARAADKSDRP
jgi:fructokinase